MATATRRERPAGTPQLQLRAAAGGLVSGGSPPPPCKARPPDLAACLTATRCALLLAADLGLQPGCPAASAQPAAPPARPPTPLPPPPAASRRAPQPVAAAQPAAGPAAQVLVPAVVGRVPAQRAAGRHLRLARHDRRRQRLRHQRWVWWVLGRAGGWGCWGAASAQQGCRAGRAPPPGWAAAAAAAWPWCATVSAAAGRGDDG